MNANPFLALFNNPDFILSANKRVSFSAILPKMEIIILDSTLLLPLLSRFNKDHVFDPKMMKMTYADFNKPLNVLSVDSFKIFYLFTNDDKDKKCLHQYKLLENTKSLIYGLKE